MTREEEERLAKAFQEKHGTHDGWTFAHEYPGVFVYTRPEHPSVFFTPDFEEDLFVDIEIGETSHGAVPYEAPLLADNLFGIVLPFLGRAERELREKRRARDSDLVEICAQLVYRIVQTREPGAPVEGFTLHDTLAEVRAAVVKRMLGAKEDRDG